ncbi:MAG: Uma2 family endonuclease [Steroidobacteraceae bacterium]
MSTVMASSPKPHCITVDEYHRMAEVGLLASDSRVELIEGEIIDMPPIGPPHSAVVARLDRLVQLAVGDRALIRIQDPVRLDSRSEPQPDLALLKPRDDWYSRSHPAPAHVLLLIEVGNASAQFDRDVKAPLYARHAIPEVWLVDLDQMQLGILRSPLEGAYTEVSYTASPGIIPIPGLRGVSVDLSRLLSL